MDDGLEELADAALKWAVREADGVTQLRAV